MAALLIACLLLPMLLLIALGYWLAQGRLSEQQTELAAGWQALDNVRRIRAVFLDARKAMQAEAYRLAQTSRAGDGSHDHGRG